MKALFVIQRSSDGGAEHVVTQVARYISGAERMGVSVDLVTLLDSEADAEAGVHAHALGVSRVIAGFFPLWMLVRRESPDVVLSTLKHVTILVSLVRLAAFFRFRHVCRIANTHSEELASISRMRRLFMRLGVRFSHCLVTRFICVSDGVKDDLVRRFSVKSARCITIRNPVEPTRLDRLAMEAVVGREAVPRNRKTVLSVGRLSRQKDQATLLEAMAQVVERIDCQLVLLGDGPLRQALTQQVRQLGLTDRVYMLGYVRNPYPWYREADVFALSSRFEGLPNVVLEALYFGLPVVSTDCPHGPSEILRDFPEEALVPVGDAAALAQAIANQLVCGRKSVRRRETIARDYSIDAIAEKYCQVVRDE